MCRRASAGHLSAPTFHSRVSPPTMCVSDSRSCVLLMAVGGYEKRRYGSVVSQSIGRAHIRLRYLHLLSYPHDIPPSAARSLARTLPWSSSLPVSPSFP